MKKRIVSLLLVLCMMVSLVPVVAVETETADEEMMSIDVNSVPYKEELEKFLFNLQGVEHNYCSKNNEAIIFIMFGEGCALPHIDYSIYPVIQPEYKDSPKDALRLFGNSGDGYYIYEKEAIDWIGINIMNLSIDKLKNGIERCKNQYIKEYNEKYYELYCGGGDIAADVIIKDVKKKNDLYYIEYELKTYYYKETCYAIMQLKNINGKEYWSIYSNTKDGFTDFNNVLSFLDTFNTDWYADDVKYVVENSIMSGTSTTTFSPNLSATRGQFVTTLYRIAGSPATETVSFSDVKSSDWYADAVSWAAKNGIAGGVGNGKFNPGGVLTREQIALMLYRYAGYEGYDTSQSADLTKFTDLSGISAESKDAIAWANAMGVLSGTSSTQMNPKGQATRAQMAAILHRFCENCRVAGATITDLSCSSTFMGTVNQEIPLYVTLKADKKPAKNAASWKITPSEGVTVVESSVTETVKKGEYLLCTKIKVPATGEYSVTVSAGKKTATASLVVLDKFTTNAFQDDDSSEIKEKMASAGTKNTIQYLTTDGNFPASSFVQEKDGQFGAKVVRFTTNFIYRGTDGWKELFNESTTVESAEKILAGLLLESEDSFNGLAYAKSASEYGNAISEAWKNYLITSNMKTLMTGGQYNSLVSTLDWETYNKTGSLVLNNQLDNIDSWLNQNSITKDSLLGKALLGFKNSSQLSEVISSGLECTGYALDVVSATEETINSLIQYRALRKANEMYCDMLLYVQKNCKYDAVQKAASNLYSTIQKNDAEAAAELARSIATPILETAVGVGANVALDKALVTAIQVTPFAYALKGFQWGVDLSNLILSTGDEQAMRDQLRVEAFLASCLSEMVLEKQSEFEGKAKLPAEGDQTAKELYYSLYLLWHTRIAGEKMLQDVLKLGLYPVTSNEWYTVSVDVSKALNSFQTSIFTVK